MTAHWTFHSKRDLLATPYFATWKPLVEELDSLQQKQASTTNATPPAFLLPDSPQAFADIPESTPIIAFLPSSDHPQFAAIRDAATAHRKTIALAHDFHRVHDTSESSGKAGFILVDRQTANVDNRIPKLVADSLGWKVESVSSENLEAKSESWSAHTPLLSFCNSSDLNIQIQIAAYAAHAKFFLWDRQFPDPIKVYHHRLSPAPWFGLGYGSRITLQRRFSFLLQGIKQSDSQPPEPNILHLRSELRRASRSHSALAPLVEALSHDPDEPKALELWENVVPLVIRRMVVYTKALLGDDEREWFVEPQNRRMLAAILARQSEDVVWRSETDREAFDEYYKSAFARFIVSSVTNEDWMRTCMFAAEHIQDWPRYLETAIREDTGKFGGNRELFAHVSRAQIDLVQKRSDEKALEIIAVSKKWCQHEAEDRRSRGLAAIQLARIAAIESDQELADSTIAQAYERYPDLKDGYTQVALVHRARQNFPIHFELLWRDLEQKRQSHPSILLHARFLAQDGQLDRAWEILEKFPVDGLAANFCETLFQNIAAKSTRSGLRSDDLTLLDRIQKALENEWDSPHASAKTAIILGKIYQFFRETACTEIIEAAYARFGKTQGAYAQVAAACLMRLDFKNAKTLFEKDLERKSLPLDISYVRYALSLAMTGELDKAANALETLVAAAKNRLGFATELVRLFLNELRPLWLRWGSTKRIQNAIAWCLDRFEQTNPHPETAFIKSRCYTMLGDYQTALEEMESIRDTAEQTFVKAVAEQCVLLVEAAEESKGLDLFDQALPGFANDPRRAKDLLRILVSRHGYTEDLARIAQTLFENSGKKVDFKSSAASVLIDKLQAKWIANIDQSSDLSSELETANQLLQADIDEGCNSHETRLALSRLAILRDKDNTSLPEIDQWYADDSNASDAYAAIASMQQNMRRFDTACSLFEKDLSAQKLHVGVHLCRYAALLTLQERDSEAASFVQQAYTQESVLRGGYTLCANQLFYDLLPAWETSKGADLNPAVDRCIALCLKDIESERHNALSFSILARCHYMKGKMDTAIRYLEQSSIDFPFIANTGCEIGLVPRNIGRVKDYFAFIAEDQKRGNLDLPSTRFFIRTMAKYGKTQEARQIAQSEENRIFRPASELRSALHAVDPYQDFAGVDKPQHTNEWHSKSDIFAELIDSVRPNLIIEVGSWLGGSAIEMAKQCNARNLPTQIACVDTWLGAVEFWLDQSDPTRYQALNLKGGYPSVYYNFIDNCLKAGVSDRITPFPQASGAAAIWFELEGFRAELIYIDASHTYEDVIRDIKAYWKVLAPGGTMFGDDFKFTDVRNAVEDFARDAGVSFEERHDDWIIKKPLA